MRQFWHLSKLQARPIRLSAQIQKMPVWISFYQFCNDAIEYLDDRYQRKKDKIHIYWLLFNIFYYLNFTFPVLSVERKIEKKMFLHIQTQANRIQNFVIILWSRFRPLIQLVTELNPESGSRHFKRLKIIGIVLEIITFVHMQSIQNIVKFILDSKCICWYSGIALIFPY